MSKRNISREIRSAKQGWYLLTRSRSNSCSQSISADSDDSSTKSGTSLLPVSVEEDAVIMGASEEVCEIETSGLICAWEQPRKYGGRETQGRGSLEQRSSCKSWRMHVFKPSTNGSSISVIRKFDKNLTGN